MRDRNVRFLLVLILLIAVGLGGAFYWNTQRIAERLSNAKQESQTQSRTLRQLRTELADSRSRIDQEYAVSESARTEDTLRTSSAVATRAEAALENNPIRPAAPADSSPTPRQEEIAQAKQQIEQLSPELQKQSETVRDLTSQLSSLRDQGLLLDGQARTLREKKLAELREDEEAVAEQLRLLDEGSKMLTGRAVELETFTVGGLPTTGGAAVVQLTAIHQEMAQNQRMAAGLLEKRRQIERERDRVTGAVPAEALQARMELDRATRSVESRLDSETARLRELQSRMAGVIGIRDAALPGSAAQELAE